MDKKCQNCLFWDNSSYSGDIEGDCRRYAPKPSENKEGKIYWPITLAAEWCGEWQANTIYKNRKHP